MELSGRMPWRVLAIGALAAGAVGALVPGAAAAPATPAASASVIAAAATPAGAGGCTRGTNTTPPTTIRVYRVKLGRVDTVDFRTYVRNVLPREWNSGWPAASLQAGAMAVKEFGWYQALHASRYHGSSCYNLTDNTSSQVYVPGSAVASTDAAVAATWSVRMSKSGAIFQAQYCATDTACGRRAPGTSLSQWGSRDLALQGLNHQQILRHYYGSSVAFSKGTGGGTITTPRSVSVAASSSKSDIRALQYLLTANGIPTTVDGVFGPKTRASVRRYQSRHGLSVDGVSGPRTMRSITAATVRAGDRNGSRVRAVQQLLVKNGYRLALDGALGPRTTAAVKSFQRARHLMVDGAVGPTTWSYLL